MTNRIPVTVPDIGDFKDVEVIDVLVKVPDAAALAGFSQLGFYPVSIQVSESVFRVGFPNSET